jgi:hypothetical protein
MLRELRAMPFRISSGTERSYGAGGEEVATSSLHVTDGVPPNDLSRSLVALDQNSTIIAVVELSQSSWLVGGVLPGIERQPRKKLEPSPERLCAVLHRWRDEAVRAGKQITRIALAFEAGRDGFWLARWLAARGVEAHAASGKTSPGPTEQRPSPWAVGVQANGRIASSRMLIPPDPATLPPVSTPGGQGRRLWTIIDVAPTDEQPWPIFWSREDISRPRERVGHLN